MAIVVKKKKCSPFITKNHPQREALTRGGVDGQPQQIYREQQIPGKTEGLADPTFAHHL